MVRLIRRFVLLSSAGAAGWLLWSRRGTSGKHDLAASAAGANAKNPAAAWPPLQPDSNATGSAAGSGASGRNAAGQSSAAENARIAAEASAEADTALRIAADAVAGETEARFETQAARRDAAKANAQADAAVDIANAALAAEQRAETDAAIANAQADAAVDIANAALAAEQAAEIDAAEARAEAAAADATADAALGFASNVASAVDQIDWNLKWVPPNDDGTCPASHPIKGNDGSKIYHVPGGMSYKRTKAERCYAAPADAEADGYRPAKR